MFFFLLKLDIAQRFQFEMRDKQCSHLYTTHVYIQHIYIQHIYVQHIYIQHIYKQHIYIRSSDLLGDKYNGMTDMYNCL